MRLDDDDIKLLHISWENINDGADALADHILRYAHELPDVIISTQKDAITASLVSNIVNIPLCIVHLNDKQNGIILECIPKFGMAIRSGIYEQAPLPSVAIISTLIDDNRNVDDLISHYKKHDHEVKTLSIYSRLKVENPPDYNWIKLTKHVRHIFPWQEK